MCVCLCLCLSVCMCKGRVTVVIYQPFMSNNYFLSLLILFKSRKEDVGKSSSKLFCVVVYDGVLILKWMAEMARYLVTINYTFSIYNKVSMTHFVKVLFSSGEINYFLEAVRPVSNPLVFNRDRIYHLKQVYITNKCICWIWRRLEEGRKETRVRGRKEGGKRKMHILTRIPWDSEFIAVSIQIL